MSSNLLEATRSGDRETVEEILRHSDGKVEGQQRPIMRRLHRRRSQPDSALHVACSNGHEEIANLLLNNGANVNVRGKGGVSPLHEASQSGCHKIVRLLLKHGASVNIKDNQRNSPLNFALTNQRRFKTVQVLLQHGANVNHRDNNGNTPLHVAVKHGHGKTVNALLQKDAHVNHQDKLGNTPLHLAAKFGREEVVRALLQFPYLVNLQDKAGNSPLHLATENGHVETVKILLLQEASVDLENKMGNTPLHLACKHSKLEIMHLLLNHGANKHPENKKGHCPIYVASKQGHEDMTMSLIKHDIKCFDFHSNIFSKPKYGTFFKVISEVQSNSLSYPPKVLTEQFLECKQTLFVTSCKIGATNLFTYLHHQKIPGINYKELLWHCCRNGFNGLAEMIFNHDPQSALDYIGEDGTTSLLLAFAKELPIWSKMRQKLSNCSYFKEVAPIKHSKRLIEFSKQIPAYNDAVEHARKLSTTSMHRISTNTLETLILGDLCPLRDAKLANLNPMALNKVDISPCLLACNKKEECLRTKDLIVACKLLEEDMKSSGTMAELLPQFILIGSIPEGTRLKPAAELDITVQLMPNNAYKKYFFIVDDTDPFILRTNPDIPKDEHPARAFVEKGVINCGKMLCGFIQAVEVSLNRIKDNIKHATEGRLQFNTSKEHCPKCQEPIKQLSRGNFYSHCKKCSFSLTHSKMGATLVLQWSDQKEKLTVTVDLVPVFPIASKTRHGQKVDVIKLQSIHTKGLMKNRPPNWTGHLKSYVKKDMIMPDAFQEQMDSQKPMMIGLKLLNYGKGQNCIIHPAQRMQIDAFDSQPKLKILYCTLKALKILFKIDLSSYFMKKIILLENFQHSIEKYSRFDWAMVQGALTETALRPYFEDYLDIPVWDPCTYKWLRLRPQTAALL